LMIDIITFSIVQNGYFECLYGKCWRLAFCIIVMEQHALKMPTMV
jgi:hypothetical protein